MGRTRGLPQSRFTTSTTSRDGCHGTSPDSTTTTPGGSPGCSSATALCDLVKAYELLRHVNVLDGVTRSGFCMVTLRLLLAIDSGQRLLCADGVVSEIIRTAGATILAGSIFGPGILRMTLQDPLDRWLTLWPLLSLILFVDDLGVQYVATRRHIRRLLPKALDSLEIILVGVGASMSKGREWEVGGKSIIVVTDPFLRAALVRPCAGVAWVRSSRLEILAPTSAVVVLRFRLLVLKRCVFALGGWQWSSPSITRLLGSLPVLVSSPWRLSGPRW